MPIHTNVIKLINKSLQQQEINKIDLFKKEKLKIKYKDNKYR